MGLKKSVANRLGNGKKLDIRRLTSDEITKHIKITAKIVKEKVQFIKEM